MWTSFSTYWKRMKRCSFFPNKQTVGKKKRFATYVEKMCEHRISRNQTANMQTNITIKEKCVCRVLFKKLSPFLRALCMCFLMFGPLYGSVHFVRVTNKVNRLCDVCSRIACPAYKPKLGNVLTAYLPHCTFH